MTLMIITVVCARARYLNIWAMFMVGPPSKASRNDLLSIVTISLLTSLLSKINGLIAMEAAR